MEDWRERVAFHLWNCLSAWDSQSWEFTLALLATPHASSRCSSFPSALTWEFLGVHLVSAVVNTKEALGTGSRSFSFFSFPQLGIKQWKFLVSSVFRSVLNSFIFLCIGSLRKFIVTGWGTETHRYWKETGVCFIDLRPLLRVQEVHWEGGVVCSLRVLLFRTSDCAVAFRETCG